MKSTTRALIWTYVFGGLISAATIIVGGFVYKEMAIVMSSTIPLLAVLIADRVAVHLKVTADRDLTVGALSELIPRAEFARSFNNSAEAINYMIENVPRCSKIYNTRLAPHTIESSDAGNVQVTGNLDEVVARGIRRGLDYQCIFSSDHEETAKALKQARDELARKRSRIGSCVVHIIPQSDVPFLHFAILEMSGSKELLLGWALHGPADFSEQVFLIRDLRFVMYFDRFFRNLASKGRPV